MESTQEEIKCLKKDCPVDSCSGCEKRDFSNLDPRFTPFYESGERIEVEWKKGFEDYTGYGCRTEGKKARFTVGMSTGWKPIYLIILKSNSFGGGSILYSAVKSIRPLVQSNSWR